MIKNKIHSEKCPNCKINFLIDDVDFNFKGNENDYCYCEKCGLNALIKVRFGKVWKIEYYKEGEEN